MPKEEKNRYYQELSYNLQHEGFAVGLRMEEGCLPVGLNGRRLCLVLDSGNIRYQEEDVNGTARSEALNRVMDIAGITAEYMRQMEVAPKLTASGLAGDYKLLAGFNDIVLAGHLTKYGVQFVTWEQTQNHTAVYAGHYYGPYVGTASYTAAKRDFSVRSGLIPDSALFTPEQLTEVYRSIHETMESSYPITDERRKYLESTAEQIERSVPDLHDRVSLSNQKELELADLGPLRDGGMQFS